MPSSMRLVISRRRCTSSSTGTSGWSVVLMLRVICQCFSVGPGSGPGGGGSGPGSEQMQSSTGLLHSWQVGWPSHSREGLPHVGQVARWIRMVSDERLMSPLVWTW